MLHPPQELNICHLDHLVYPENCGIKKPCSIAFAACTKMSGHGLDQSRRVPLNQLAQDEGVSEGYHEVVVQ